MASTTDSVRIRYHRPPDRIELFVQRVVHRARGCTVTFLEAARVRPMEIAGTLALEPGAPVVWFTFDGAWHDIGRFHLRDGTFTGCYANVLTPVTMREDEWETTDLFLDVWLPRVGTPVLLDEDELDAAERAGAVDPVTAARAREEADTLIAAARRGSWPPPIVAEWTLERVRGTPPRPPV